MIALTDFKKTYFGTVLGYLWSLARPLLLFAVMVTVFTKMFQLDKVPHYRGAAADEHRAVRVLPGGHDGPRSGRSSAQESIVRKTQFPRLVIPLSVVLTSLFNLLLNLVVVVIFILAFGVTPMWTWLLFPVVLLLLIVITIAVSMIVSSLYPALPRRRDHLDGVLDRALLRHADPLHGGLAVGHPTLRHLILLNPLAPIFELARKWIIDPSAPGPAAAAGGYLQLLAPLAIYARVLRAGGVDLQPRGASDRRAAVDCDRPRGRDPHSTFDPYLHDPLQWGASMAHHAELMLRLPRCGRAARSSRWAPTPAISPVCWSTGPIQRRPRDGGRPVAAGSAGRARRPSTPGSS